MSQDHDMEMDEVKTPEEALTPDEDHELINDSSHLSSKLKEVLDQVADASAMIASSNGHGNSLEPPHAIATGDRPANQLNHRLETPPSKKVSNFILPSDAYRQHHQEVDTTSPHQSYPQQKITTQDDV